MEELKMLLELVAQLPQTALWVLIGFWAYKVMIVGSVFGVIKLAIERGHSWAVTRKIKYEEVRPMLDGVCITGTKPALMAQLNRLIGISSKVGVYIHDCDVAWLRAAIDEKIERDSKKETQA